MNHDNLRKELLLITLVIIPIIIVLLVASNFHEKKYISSHSAFNCVTGELYNISSTTVSWQGVPLQGVDPKEFVDLCNGFGRTGSHVYWVGEAIPKADPSTFRVISFPSLVGTYYPYSKDKLHVFIGSPDLTSDNTKLFLALNHPHLEY